jgi:hypothetical protein
MSSSISSSRKRLLCAAWIGSLALCVWLAGLALSFATAKLDYSEPKLLESLTFQNKPLDIVFLGNSLTLEGVSPQTIDSKLGTSSYNFALGGASLLESEFQLRHYLANNPPPKLVALGVYLDASEIYTGISPTLYYELSPALRTLYWSESQTLEQQGFDRSFVILNRLPAYRYRAVIDLIIKWLVTREDTRPRFVLGQAQAAFSRAAIDPGLPRRAAFPLNELQSFLAFCREQSIRVLVFEPPIYPGERELISNRPEILEQVTRLIAAAPSASFVSFADLGATYDRGDWVNLDHLNVRGAAKFSDRLAAALLK